MFINNELYVEDIKNAISSIKEIERLRNKKIFITGSNGLIGSFIIDVIMYLNKVYDYNTYVIANSRKKENIEKRFSSYLNNGHFKYYIGNINEEIKYDDDIDYIINCASNTHPILYANEPIETIITNVIGNYNILNFASKKNVIKTIFLSSVEIYGENTNNIDRFKENEMGYIDCNTLRAGYNESKRVGEALCQAFIEEKKIDVSIVRLPRVYGPTVKDDDTKVMSQFIKKALLKEDIVLKSEGNQYFSYLYVVDAVVGIFDALIKGKKGEVYNLGNINSDIRLKDLAQLIANISNVKVVFDIPSDVERKGFSKATIARLNYDKAFNELDYSPKYSISDGVNKTINILKMK